MMDGEETSSPQVLGAPLAVTETPALDDLEPL